MRHPESENISAVLDLLIYNFEPNKSYRNVTIRTIVEYFLKKSLDKTKLQTIIKNNPEIGELTLVDYSLTSGEYGISENPGGLYAATFVFPVRRRP